MIYGLQKRDSFRRRRLSVELLEVSHYSKQTNNRWAWSVVLAKWWNRERTETWAGTTQTHTLNFSSARKRPHLRFIKTRLIKLRKRKRPKAADFFLSKAFFTCFCLTICAEGSAGRGFFFISGRVLWSSSEPPATSNISLLSRPTPDLMGQVPCQRQFWAWVLGCSGCHGQQRWITAWECNAGIWIKKREFLVTGVKEKKKPSSNCILQNTQRKI